MNKTGLLRLDFVCDLEELRGGPLDFQMPLEFHVLDCWAERLGVMVSSVRDKVVHRTQAEKH